MLLYMCPDTTTLGDHNMVTVDEWMISEMLQREHQFVAVLGDTVSE